MRHANPLHFSPTSSTRRPPAADPRKRLKGRDLVLRAAVAELLRAHGEMPVQAVARVYQRCPATIAYVERAAVSPAMIDVATWAAELVMNAAPDFLDELAPQSAFSLPQPQCTSVFGGIADHARTCPGSTRSRMDPKQSLAGPNLRRARCLGPQSQACLDTTRLDMLLRVPTVW